jgi:hypothetical protein
MPVGGGGGGGADPTPTPDPVALRSPHPGDQCYGSTLALGDNYPVNTTDAGHSINNILPLTATNQSGATDVLGWEYSEQNGSVYFQGNPNFQDFLSNATAAIPLVGPLAAAFENGGIVPLNSTQMKNLINYANAHGGKLGSACFNSNLA